MPDATPTPPTTATAAQPERLFVIALSGGPCAGKSSVLAMLRQKLSAYGASVFVIPELATEILSNGVDIQKMIPQGADDEAGRARYREFQAIVLRAIIAREDYWTALATLQPGELKVVICDRGRMDVRAYMAPGDFEAMVYDLGLTTADLRDKPYDAVLHMVTAARGAESAYTTENNTARHETVEEARALDDRTRAAWTGHRNLRVFGNTAMVDGKRESLPFEKKKEMVLAEVCRMVGLPVPSRTERKYLVAPSFNRADLPADAVVSDIDQVYLRPVKAQVERYVRSVRGTGEVEGGLYVYTEKRYLEDGSRVKEERVIKAREYRALLLERIPARGPVVKRRTSFVHDDQYFHLDEFSAPESSSVLEVELTEDQPLPSLPACVPTEGDVTQDPKYRNATIATRSRR